MPPEVESGEPLVDAGSAGGPTPHPDDSPIEPIDTAGAEPETDAGALPDAPIKAVVEALLFACEEPVTREDLESLLGEDRAAEIESAIHRLTEEYGGRGGGLRVQRIGGGFRISTDPSLAPFLKEFVKARNRQRLSRAALETLAVIAYKQPITAPEIQEIRGVNPSAILNALLDRRLVRILGRKKVVGKPFVYGTTREFLIRFGLNSLQDLPSMEEFEAMTRPESEPLPFPDDPGPPDAPASPAEIPAPDAGEPEPDPREPDVS